MTCYQCGSEDGSEVQLCPSCRTSRGKEQRQYDVREKVLEEFRWNWRHIKEIIIHDSLVLFVGIWIFILGSLYYIGISGYGPGLFLTRIQYVVKQCKLEVAHATALRASGTKVLPPSHAFAIGGVWEKELKKYFGPVFGGNMLRGLTVGLEGSCDDIRRECEKSNGAALCNGLFEVTKWGRKASRH